ncbi:MAG: alkaline phosphatase family protein [Anaerolineae bacterium]|nr:MAG: alkaline phosphatase family protein [Anaerolineae bacterium]
MNRVLVLGLDGASLYLVRRWQEDLPNLRKLMAEGTSGVLWSVIPPRSVPAWYCFATGMNPAKIGVFGFSQRIPETYDYTCANLTYCRAPTFWSWLSGYGISTAVVHVPGTFPPQPVRGVMVSGWPAPFNRGNLVYTHPPELSRELDRYLGRSFEFVSEKPMRTDNDAEMLGERVRILSLHGEVAYHLLGARPWQVGVVVFGSLDRASHQFWRHMDPDHPVHDPSLAGRFKDALKEVYQVADREVGRLLSLLDEEDTVFVVSDHGFGPAYRIFYLNEWLRQQGYLVLKDKGSLGKVGWRTRLVGRLSAPLFWLNSVSPNFRRLVAPLKRRVLSNFVRDEYVRAKERGLVRVNHAPVDWSRTRAYMPDEASLYLNSRGRDPDGIVKPGTEAETLREEIIAGLQSVLDPLTDQPVSMIVHRKEEVYSGPFLEDAPDLIVAMDSFTTEVMAELGSDSLFVPSDFRSGTHTPQGLFIAMGPGIPAGRSLDAGLMDVAPTVLHLMRAPVPAETDGQVLLNLFEKESEPRQRVIVHEKAGLVQRVGEVYTAEELAQVEQQLRDLGYLG